MASNAYALYTTNACANECVICVDKSENKFRYYPIGRNSLEIKALIKLFNGIERSSLALSGGDALRNIPALETAAKYHQGRKAIALNPISFLTIELKKRGSRINEEDVAELDGKIESQGISSELESIISSLAHFNLISFSKGNLQAPSPEVMTLATDFFDRQIRFRILDSADKLAQSVLFGSMQALDSDCFDMTNPKSYPSDLRCVGNVRKKIEQNGLEDKFNSQSINLDAMDCRHNFNRSLYFNRTGASVDTGEDIRLFFAPCYSVGATPYLSFDTSLDVGNMAKLESKELIDILEEDIREVTKTPYYRLFNCSKSNTPKPFSDRFEEYLKCAEDYLNYIAAINGNEPVKVMSHVLSAKKSASKCEACDTIGVLLYRAGVKPKEWQDHVNKVFKDSVF